jgi:hypothetical protein
MLVLVSLLPPDQIESDAKDTVYQTAGITHAVIPAPDQVDDDVKDTVY